MKDRERERESSLRALPVCKTENVLSPSLSLSHTDGESSQRFLSFSFSKQREPALSLSQPLFLRERELCFSLSLTDGESFRFLSLTGRALSLSRTEKALSLSLSLLQSERALSLYLSLRRRKLSLSLLQTERATRTLDSMISQGSIRLLYGDQSTLDVSALYVNSQV